MSERNYVVAHKPEEKHWCDSDRMVIDGRREGWPDYTIVQCEECGDELYYMASRGHAYMTDIRWWNRSRIYRKAGVK